jgi:uncharacterized protein
MGLVGGCMEKALLIAAEQGDKELVQLLLSQNVNPNGVDDDGCSALLNAAYYGHTEIVKVLLVHKADPLIVNNDGWSPLMYASVAGHNDIVELLLQHGADVHHRSATAAQLTALECAVWSQRMNVVKTLLSHGARVDKDIEHGGALVTAAQTGNVEILKILLAHGNGYTVHKINEALLQAELFGCDDAAALLGSLCTQEERERAKDTVASIEEGQCLNGVCSLDEYEA